MLARFENGKYLEVVVGDDCGLNKYFYTVFDEDGDELDSGKTEYSSMELYIPMNEIDYICEFCEPDWIEGKYELIDEDLGETMEDYLDYLEYGSYGDWCLERQGSDEDDVRKYRTEADARMVMLREVEELEEEYSDSDVDDAFCSVHDEEFYQSWRIYKKPVYTNEKEKLFVEIEQEIERTFVGVSQYAWELQDTSVIEDHVCEIKKLLKQLKEMI